MNTTTEFSENLCRVFAHPTGGVAGLVDALLAACRGHALQLDWQAGRCRARCRGGDGEELMDVPLRKSVFRAMLARVAVLCNERIANSVSPYGGQSELVFAANPPALCRVAFTNTSAEQRLELLIGIESAAEIPQRNGRKDLVL